MAIVTTAPLRSTISAHVERVISALPHLLIVAAIGVEALAIAALLPLTLDVWRDPAHYGHGDFKHFYEASQSLSLSGTYNPALGALLHPLTRLSLTHAFQVYFAINVAALLGVAYVAQRAVEAPHAKLAMALGVLALPQTHWALRVGHFTEILAFASLGGFLLASKRPWLAGLLFAMLALKPQYLPVPVLYLLFTRNWRGLGALAGVFGLMSVAGVVAAGVSIADAGGYYADRVAYVIEDVAVGQSELLLPVQESWQYSWRGFLVSAGIEPNPLLVADLLALSAGAMILAWWRCTPAVARVAAALGMLLLAPYSTFYNWSMIAVAAALLVRSDLKPRWLTPAILASLALAAVASQAATPFPGPDRFATADTRGLYWIQPVALLTLFVLAIAGRRQHANAEAATERPPSLVERLRALASVRAPALAAHASAIACAAAIGYLGAAYVSSNAPFEPGPYFSRQAVVDALPADFPLPPGAELRDAGPGTMLPYRIEWSTPLRTSEVAGIMKHRLADGPWSITHTSETDDDTIVLRSARDAAGTDGDVVADVSLLPFDGGTRVRLEFSPLPPTRIAAYDRWLEDQGIIVKNVAPEDYPDLRTR
ncbi:MAG: glycosyltransferase family 87 protein [Dehalococcoidia bacterium]